MWHINLENTSSFSYYFPVNVLRKEITFEKASPVIKVCLATDNADTSTPTSKPRRTGRKRSAAKVEDEELVKRIKRGQDFERNERQRKDLEEMNKALEELNGSKAVNEYTILCGRCKKQKLVPVDRTLKARTEYFKKKHYETACAKQKSTEATKQKSTVEIAKMRNTMQQFLARSDPAANASQPGPNNVDYDCDRDEEIDCLANASME